MSIAPLVVMSERFGLRAPRPSDLDALVSELGDPGVTATLPDAPHPLSEADASDWLDEASRDDLLRVVITDAEDVLLGAVDLWLGTGSRQGTAQIRFWLGRTHWGKGIMSDVAPRVLSHAFGALKLVKVEASVFQNNPQALRILEKNHFQLEGVRRQAVWHRGARMDLFVYGLLKTEFPIGDA